MIIQARRCNGLNARAAFRSRGWAGGEGALFVAISCRRPLDLHVYSRVCPPQAAAAAISNIQPPCSASQPFLPLPLQSKINETKDLMKKKALEIEKTKIEAAKGGE